MASTNEIAALGAPQRIAAALERALPRLAPAARTEVERLLDPRILGILATVLAGWLMLHVTGIGQIVDAVLMAAGALAIGVAVFDGIEHLLAFAALAQRARTEADLERAAEHFAKAVAILGIQTVLAVLLRGAPKTFRTRPLDVGKAPPFAVGLRMEPPPLRVSGLEPAGTGGTTPWGEIVISRHGSATDRRLTALHESVHRLLTPKLAPLRVFRIRQNATSYAYSALRMYLEEALAETYAQVSVHGVRATVDGLSFPVRNGYVTVLRRMPLAPGEAIEPVLPEAAGLVASGITTAGGVYDAWLSRRPPALAAGARQSAGIGR
jgi:hypothetical protein